jgi:hypothetical protein
LAHRHSACDDAPGAGIRAAADIGPTRWCLNDDCGDGHFPVSVNIRICRVNIEIINEFRLLRRQDGLDSDRAKTDRREFSS